MKISPESFTLIISSVQIAILIAMAIITYKYTKATKQMVKLEEDRKVWEVQPVLAISKQIEGINKEGHANPSFFFTKVSLKNIGRGIAIIKKFDYSYGTTHLSENINYIIPNYLGVADEFTFTKIQLKNIRDQELSFDCKYSDMHGNSFEYIFEWGVEKYQGMIK